MDEELDDVDDNDVNVADDEFELCDKKLLPLFFLDEGPLLTPGFRPVCCFLLPELPATPVKVLSELLLLDFLRLVL